MIKIPDMKEIMKKGIIIIQIDIIKDRTSFLKWAKLVVLIDENIDKMKEDNIEINIKDNKDKVVDD